MLLDSPSPSCCELCAVACHSTSFTVAGVLKLRLLNHIQERKPIHAVSHVRMQERETHCRHGSDSKSEDILPAHDYICE